MTLDISTLSSAVDRLAEGLARYELDTSDDQIRDGLIQRFEFTYELCHKMLRRYLMAAAPSPDTIEQLAFPDLIRVGNEQGLLHSEWKVWRHYRDIRNITSHTYNAAKAREVAEAIPAFLAEAQVLRDRLQTRVQTL
jgi:nucleotidyltransferase substrate binding protein (TIGR01987 family)